MLEKEQFVLLQNEDNLGGREDITIIHVWGDLDLPLVASKVATSRRSCFLETCLTLFTYPFRFDHFWYGAHKYFFYDN